MGTGPARHARERVDGAPSSDARDHLSPLPAEAPSRLGRRARWFSSKSQPLNDARIQLFLDAPEARAQGLKRADWVNVIGKLEASYEGREFHQMNATDLMGLLLERVPRKIEMGTGDAVELFDELRAFFSFLTRTWRSPHAESCRDVLQGWLARRVRMACWEVATSR